ncbi:response regulator [bacterium]|nr:response regulator [bacterium]
MSQGSPKLRVLVVDDEKEFRDLVALQLERKGYSVKTANNGKVALELILTSKFDVAVCDIRMPFMDGIELFREVKQAPPPHPRFIFLTAFGQYSADEILASGAAAVLYKPYSLSDLIENIENQRSKILLIEDNLLTSDLTKKRLERRGFQITPALDGETALDALADEEYDLIILDFLLPDMTGFDILKKLPNYPKNSDKPVILLTAETDTDTIVEAFSLGARDYIVKPFDFKTLNARILAHLNSGQKSHDLKVARETALESSRVKSMFLANMSHEIRTPLNGILGTANLLKQTPLNQEQESYVEIVESAGNTLMMILNDLLDISKIESGNLELENRPFNLRKVIKNSMELFFQSADSKQVDVFYHIHEDLPETVTGDSARLRQIISNLASNALKFTPSSSGHVTLSLVPNKNFSTDSVIRFEMIDNGVGISEKNQKNLFNAFRQADSSTFRKFGGTGLGLSICKQLSSMMGGEIGVNSKEGDGSTFWFTVNLNRAEDSKVAPLRISKTFIDKNVAIISPYPTAVRATSQMLGQMGFKSISSFGNPYELSVSENWEELDLIITDLDAFKDYTMLKKVSSNKKLAAKNWVISKFTPQKYDQDILHQSLNIVCELKKPLRYELTQTNLEEALENAEYGSTTPQTTEQPVEKHVEKIAVITVHEEKTEHQVKTAQVSSEKIEKIEKNYGHVLVVDDNETNQIVLGKMLEKGGFTFKSTGTVQEALEEVNSEAYDVILMDYQLPGMVGSDVTRIIRKNKSPKIADVPVLAITASRKKEDIDDCLDSGMNGIVEKPTTIDRLREQILDALNSSDQTAPKKAV